MRRPIKKVEKIRCTITLDKDVFIDSADFISNLSGFINKTLKEYIEYKKKELEKDQKTSANLSSHNNLLCKTEIDYEEMKKIASTPWTKEYQQRCNFDYIVSQLI